MLVILVTLASVIITVKSEEDNILLDDINPSILPIDTEGTITLTFSKDMSNFKEDLTIVLSGTPCIVKDI